MTRNRFDLSLATAGMALLLTACGGGGSSGGTTVSNSSGNGTPQSSAGSNPSAIAGDVSTPQYAAASIESAAFQLVNQTRQQCGFPVLADNTLLDKAAASHANYENLNNIVSDTEVAGSAGFTGVSYQNRAVIAGYPSGIAVGGESTGFYNGQNWTAAQVGQQLIYGLLSGVYHVGGIMSPATDAGFGQVSVPYNGFPEYWAALTYGNPQPVVKNGPLTFPCQGVTGIAYKGAGEIPTPPNTSGAWGTPVAVVGNATDTIALNTGSMTDSSGNTIQLQLLDSANDPNKELPAYMASAYAVSPLKPDTQYSVTVTGTDNGTPFSRSFTFTTGNIVG
jgi:hypothetical protein